MLFKLMLVMTFGCSVLSFQGCPTQGYREWVIVGSHCAKHFHEEHNFGEAERICQGQHENGHLISVHDGKANDDLRVLTGNWYKRTWIGGQKMPYANSWMWTDGSKWNYQNWVPGEPDGIGDCVQINYHTPGKFDDVQCWSKRGFVCAFPIEK
ncbi:hypothetical protein ACEWY4_005576 [Coilia grayii]|uniref:C-type lectin domain-containing protein n=1 Tax=Coilia grayii TaxID=363190 RepID=A0ABD1KJC5_9TELE